MVTVLHVLVLSAHGSINPRVDIGRIEVTVTALCGKGIRASLPGKADKGHGWGRLSIQLFYPRQEMEFMQE